MKYSFAILSFLLLIGCAQPNATLPIDDKLFAHGVASGDPLTDRVIIWTRVSTELEKATVEWQISSSSDFNTILQTGKVGTDAKRDFTVKVDVDQLKSGTNYYYRFNTEGKRSMTGKTKTLNVTGDDPVKLAVVSCSNYEFGYFNAYDGMDNLELDAVLHLGDYIYEYGPDVYGDKSFSQKHLPPHELLTLEDYRTRYAQYRSDVSLQNAHREHPFIMIWDDHEIANNAHETGAQNHQADEGEYMTRKKIAKKAYYEWQPIREQKGDELYRAFHFGDLVDLVMLDERYIGRNAPPESQKEVDNERTMLGTQQLAWFKNELSISKAQWKIIGNQVIFSPCDLSKVRPNSPVNFDAWDGYATERDDIRNFLSSSDINNTIFVTGDTHMSWAFNVPALSDSENGANCAIEIGTPSITSANWNDSAEISDEQTIVGEQTLMDSNPHLKFVNGRDHGFVVLDINKENTKAQWYYTANIKTPKSEVSLAKEFIVKAGSLELLD